MSFTPKKDWISSGGTESDWPFSGPMLGKGGKSSGSPPSSIRTLGVRLVGRII